MIPDSIIIHCSATRENQNFTIEQIDISHKNRNPPFNRSATNIKRPYAPIGVKCVYGFIPKHCGYQYYIRRNGDIYRGRHEDETGAHCLNYNNHSIGICYEGGYNTNGKEADTRTPEQIEAINALVKDICSRHKISEIKGHRDTSPDLNGNGIIDPFERIKACPCYDVIPEYYSFMLHEVVVTPKQ